MYEKSNRNVYGKCFAVNNKYIAVLISVQGTKGI
jgi:hypothetical protein